MKSQNPLLIFVVGPTAAGKTDFALKAAEVAEQRTGGPCEIINSDSVQVFKEIEIGTAKPTAQQLSQVPHHLISVVPPLNSYTAGEYRRDALQIIAEGKARGVRSFLIVGGSGFYVQALEKGMFQIPAASREVRERLQLDLQTRGLAPLYEELKRNDPIYALKIAAQDSYRILRALEILYGFGKTVTEVRNEFAQTENLNDLARTHLIFKMGIRVDRTVLRQRVRERTEKMLEAGWVDEVKALQKRGFNSWSPMQSVGYRDIQTWLGQTSTLEELSEQIVISTMQLAKRQATWFRREPCTQWFESETRWEQGLKIFDLRLADLT